MVALFHIFVWHLNLLSLHFRFSLCASRFWLCDKSLPTTMTTATIITTNIYCYNETSKWLNELRLVWLCEYCALESCIHTIMTKCVAVVAANNQSLDISWTFLWILENQLHRSLTFFLFCCCCHCCCSAWCFFWLPSNIRKALKLCESQEWQRNVTVHHTESSISISI